MKMKVFAAITFIGCCAAGVVLAIRDSKKKEEEVNDLVTETIDAMKTNDTCDDEYKELLKDSRERIIMAIDDIAVDLNSLDACGQDYERLVERQKGLLENLHKLLDEEARIESMENADIIKTAETEAKKAERKRNFRDDLLKLLIPGFFSLAGVYLIEAFQAGGWIIKSPAMQWIPKPKV